MSGEIGGATTLSNGHFVARHETPVKGVWIWAVVASFPALLTVNPLATVASLFCAALLVALLWRGGEPPVLLFCCLMQWLQVATAVFLADFQGVPIRDLYIAVDAEEAVWLGLSGLIVLALGMRWALRQTKKVSPQQLHSEIAAASLPSLFAIFLACYVASLVLSGVTLVLPGLTQVVVSLFHLRWAFLFVLLYACLARGERYDLVVISITLELLVGVLGYFSGFTRVFFVLFLVVAVESSHLKARGRAALAVAVVVFTVFAVVWTSVKTDYRAYLNQGSGEQEVLVSAADASAVLLDLVSSLDVSSLAAGANNLVERIAYVEFFAATLDYVPEVVPHQEGGLWIKGVFGHILRPRLLFPDKEELDDSEQTRQYTGRTVAGMDEGTAISLGYFAESYIDFGRIGMMVPIFLLGVFWGYIYKYFVFRGESTVFGLGIAISILLSGAGNFGSSNVKLIGGSLVAVIVMTLMRRYVIRRLAANSKVGPRL